MVYHIHFIHCCNNPIINCLVETVQCINSATSRVEGSVDNIGIHARYSRICVKISASNPRIAISGERRGSPFRAASPLPTAKLSTSTSSVRPPKVQTGERSDKLVNNMPPTNKELSRELTDSHALFSGRSQQERGPTAKLALGYCLISSSQLFYPQLNGM